MEPLTPTDVENALRAKGLDVEVRVFDESTATAALAAEHIGTSLGSIAKSIVFMVNGQPLVVITSGDKKVDTRKIAALYDVGRKKVKIASAEQCIEHIGYAPGGVPPLGHRTDVPIYIDETMSRFEIVYAAAGSPHTIFPIPYQKLVDITQGKVWDLVTD